MNEHRLNESVATDTVYCNTPVIDDSSTSARIFVGTKTMLTDACGMKTCKEFLSKLADNIRQRGSMNKLISDQAQVKIVNNVKDLLRYLFIDDWKSELHCQYQNYTERIYHTVKGSTKMILNRTSAPAHCWLLAIMYS